MKNLMALSVLSLSRFMSN